MIADLVQRIESLERIVAMQASLIATQASVIAARDAEIVRLNGVIVDLNGVIIGLNEKIAKLEARLNTNSSNSSKPPSTDPPWKQKRKTSGNGKRGGQKGHAGITRELVPVEEVDAIVPCKPADFCACGGAVDLDGSAPERKQVFEQGLPRKNLQLIEKKYFA